MFLGSLSLQQLFDKTREEEGFQAMLAGVSDLGRSDVIKKLTTDCFALPIGAAQYQWRAAVHAVRNITASDKLKVLEEEAATDHIDKEVGSNLRVDPEGLWNCEGF